MMDAETKERLDTLALKVLNDPPYPAREIIQVPEGEVSVSYPPNLSLESIEEMRENFTFLIRRLKRAAPVLAKEKGE